MATRILIDFEDKDFELFKSNICQSIKQLDPVEAINQIKESNAIKILFDDEQYNKSLYLVAMVNYLSNKYNLDMNIHDYDNYKMEEMIYPRGVELRAFMANNTKIKEWAIEHAEKEFLQFNICEGEIESVY